MIFSTLLNNLLAIPILCFLFGIICSFTRLNSVYHQKARWVTLLTYFLLFCIGLKGGGSFMQHSSSQFFLLLGVMIAWGLIQPFISFWILRKFTKTDSSTAAATAACFGSVSVMTFAAGAAFLDKLQIPYESLVVALLALMEIPAILSGLLISKWKTPSESHTNKNLWIHTLFNKTILMIFLGMGVGMFSHYFSLKMIPGKVLILFKPALCLFLFHMGMVIGKRRTELNQFSWSLSLFGCYMPFLGGIFGILFSYLFGLDAGTGTLIALLSASASYIAAPAAMRMAIPEANEAIYLPLSLGIAFPFNVLIGTPLYYVLAKRVLS